VIELAFFSEEGTEFGASPEKSEVAADELEEILMAEV
jgi:hypothetical protein